MRYQQPARGRMPNASSYILMSGAAASALFFMLWWMLHNGADDTPWVPAGLAASVVMLVAVGAREVVVRRSWTRSVLEQERREQKRTETSHRSSQSRSSSSSSRHTRSSIAESFSAALRTLQRQCAEAAAPNALPEAHLEAYLSCKEFLESAEQTLRTASIGTETRLSLRAGQERVRVLARQHLLGWARGAARTLTHEAQRRARISDKIETAQRALEVIDSALKLYPEEAELRASELAVREFITTVKVSHWIELAERAAFKGHHARAIDRYRDALFYLSRGSVKEETRSETAKQIEDKIEDLRARLKTRKITATPTSRETQP